MNRFVQSGGLAGSKSSAGLSLLEPARRFAVRIADCFRAIPSAVENFREFTANSHRYSDSTGPRLALEAIREFMRSLWYYREYANNLELAASVTWEEVNAKLPAEYNFRTKSFEYGSTTAQLQARVRYELASEAYGSIKFPTPTRRQLEIDRDRRDSQALVNAYIARAEAELERTTLLWNRLFSPRASRFSTERALQRLEQYRKIDRELNSIVLKHYDTTESDFVASNRVNREVYAKLSATPGYTVGPERTSQSYRRRVAELSTSVIREVETQRDYSLEVDALVTLQAFRHFYRGRPFRIRRLTSGLKNSIMFASQSCVIRRYGQLAALTVLQRDVRRYSGQHLAAEINSQLTMEREEIADRPLPGVHSLTGL